MTSRWYTSRNGNISSKRLIGAVVVIFSMLLIIINLFQLPLGEIHPSIQVVSLQFLATGAGLILGGLFEKNNN